MKQQPKQQPKQKKQPKPWEQSEQRRQKKQTGKANKPENIGDVFEGVEGFLTIRRHGRHVIQYYGPRVIQRDFVRKDGKKIRGRREEDEVGCFEGTPVIANFCPDERLREVLSLVREVYVGVFRESALMDFYPRVESLVRRIYSGDRKALDCVKAQRKFVSHNKDLFVMAVHVVKDYQGKEFPTLANGGRGYDPVDLQILRGDLESSVDVFPKIEALVCKMYNGGKKVVEQTFCEGKEERTVEKTVYFGEKTVRFLARFQRLLVLAYEPLFTRAIEAIKADPERNFPPLDFESEDGLDLEVLRILRG